VWEVRKLNHTIPQIAKYVMKNWCVAAQFPLSLPGHMTMKIIRVPGICCRADEVDAQCFEMEWRGRVFSVMAYSETEARDWWRSLPERDREAALGGGNGGGELELF
jgi:hypothetical protein